MLWNVGNSGANFSGSERISNTSSLEYVRYELEEPKYDTEECQQRDITYAAPLRVTLRLIVFEVDEETGAKSVLDIQEIEDTAFLSQIDAAIAIEVAAGSDTDVAGSYVSSGEVDAIPKNYIFLTE